MFASTEANLVHHFLAGAAQSQHTVITEAQTERKEVWDFVMMEVQCYDMLSDSCVPIQLALTLDMIILQYNMEL